MLSSAFSHTSIKISLNKNALWCPNAAVGSPYEGHVLKAMEGEWLLAETWSVHRMVASLLTNQIVYALIKYILKNKLGLLDALHYHRQIFAKFKVLATHYYFLLNLFCSYRAMELL